MGHTHACASRFYYNLQTDLAPGVGSGLTTVRDVRATQGFIFSLVTTCVRLTSVVRVRNAFVDRGWCVGSGQAFQSFEGCKGPYCRVLKMLKLKLRQTNVS